MDYAKIGVDWRIEDELPRWQWLKETPVAIFEENELPAWGDPKQVIDAVKAMGAEHLRYPAICWGAHYYDRSDFLPKAAGIPADSDYYGQITRACRENGIRVMAYCHYGVLYRELETLHPEWLARKKDGSPEIWNSIHRKACLCSHAFQDAMKGAVREVIEKYHPDSVYLDGPAWYCADCWCDSCRERYRQAYGEDMPSSLRWEDGSRQKYNQIRDEAYNETLRGIHELTQAAGLPLLINTHMHMEREHRHGIMEAAMALDCEGANTTEVHRPGRFLTMFESAKLGEATKRISLCYCPPGPFETLRTFPIAETLVMGMAYAMLGATPMLEPVSSYFFDSSGAPVMWELCDNIRRHRDLYYRMQPVRDIALVYPRRMLESLPDSEMAQWLNSCFAGTFEALTNAGIHFDCLYDAQLSPARLRGYRALMLPASAWMEEEQLETIRDFVRQGGVLIAGPECSLFGADGKRLSDFALSDVLGVQYLHENAAQPDLPREYRESAFLHGYSRVPEAYVQSRQGLCDRLVPVSDAVVGIPNLQRFIRYSHVAPQAAEVLADLYLPADGAFGTPFTFPYGTPPAVTVHAFGNGRAYYMAAAFGYIYARRGLPEQRNLIRSIVHHALDNAPALQLDGPPSIIGYLTEDKNRRCVHLLNYTGPMAEMGRAVEWIAPVEKIGITVRVPRPVKAVTTVYPGQALPFAQQGDTVCVTLPRLDIYQSICLTYDSSDKEE